MKGIYALGYDIGSSSVKASLVLQSTGEVVFTDSHPKSDLGIMTKKSGWAEQEPMEWWSSVCTITREMLIETKIHPKKITSIGIAYQMHGLIVVDKNKEPLRPAIIWCDSRATQIGKDAFDSLGREYCFKNLLNAPGNFTASKLKWIQIHEPEIYKRIHKVMLPGDYIAMKFTDRILTTISGCSEGIFWDFQKNMIADTLWNHFGFTSSFIPDVVGSFGNQGEITEEASIETGLAIGTPISYRASDQPNNAMSLGVLEPGEVAATGGTSGVVYGVSSDLVVSDARARINTFAHVNHDVKNARLGQLLCINGAGSLFAWMRRELANDQLSFTEMNEAAERIVIGSEGLCVLPFGNGAERMLDNATLGAHFLDVEFNTHTKAHFFRAALEGIAFAFVYGLEILEELAVPIDVLKVGNDNLFQSNIFSETMASLARCRIEVVGTTGAIGAAKASAYGIGLYSSLREAIGSLPIIKTYVPGSMSEDYASAYEKWRSNLKFLIHQNSAM